MNFFRVNASLASLAILISILSFYGFSSKAEALDVKCLDASMAQQIKGLLESKKFYIDFCSTCSPQKANIRRVDISEFSLLETSCGQEIKVKGKIVRGVMPPVFGGECTDLLEVYTPSLPLDVPFETTLNPANTYAWDEESKQFASIGNELGYGKVCIKSIILKK
ncbi:MAG: hypothetical protein SFU25_08175 [Candidatus Caenarcaniphilales bacterium]|nr:hypothetical protein [Candidatus Caenarcaniphilales bacterium]